MNKKPLNKKNIINLFKKQKRVITNTEFLDIEYCKDRILAKDLKSKINLPPFNNSAVDGYAFLNSDIKNKSYLISKKRIAAGDNKKIKVKRGEAVRIFTGAKLPTNSSTVIMQENVEINKQNIIIKKIPIIGQNSRLLGEDIKKQKIILKKGTKIDTSSIN